MHMTHQHAPPVCRHGKALGYKGPQYNTQREEVLDRTVKDLEAELKQLMNKQVEFKSTLVSDGRKDAAGRPLENYVQCTRYGTIFEGVEDNSGVSKTAEVIADGIAKYIDARPAGTYAQVLTDNPSPSVKARRLLHEDPKYGGKYSKIITGGCGGHALDLFIEDVCKMENYSCIVKSIKRIVNVIYNHDKVRNEYQNVEGGGRLSRWVDTRFAIAYIMAEDVKQNKEAIKKTVASTAFSKWASTAHSRKPTDEDGDKTNKMLAQLVTADINDDDWWKSLDIFILQLSDV